MERPAQYLLTEQMQTRYFGALREAKKEWQQLDDEFMLISKYHERLGFQQSWQATYDELIIQMKRLALAMDRIQLSIDEYERAIYMHRCAVEHFHNNKTPFNGLNLTEHTLTQTKLFE